MMCDMQVYRAAELQQKLIVHENYICVLHCTAVCVCVCCVMVSVCVYGAPCYGKVSDTQVEIELSYASDRATQALLLVPDIF